MLFDISRVSLNCIYETIYINNIIEFCGSNGKLFYKIRPFHIFKKCVTGSCALVEEGVGGRVGGKLEVAEVSRLNLFYVNDNTKRCILAMTGVISS